MSDYNKDLEQKVIDLQEKLESITTDSEFNSYILEICVRLLTDFLYQETIDEGKAGSLLENVADRSIRMLLNDIREVKRNMATPRWRRSGAQSKLHDYLYMRLSHFLYKEERMNYHDYHNRIRVEEI